MICVIILQILGILGFSISTNFLLDLLMRFFIGIAQVFPAIYMPVWVDVFAYS